MLFDYSSLRAILRNHAGSPETIFSGEWGWGACRYPNGSVAVCKEGGDRGEAVTEHEQASRLARQWLINDAANISLSIWCKCNNSAFLSYSEQFFNYRFPNVFTPKFIGFWIINIFCNKFFIYVMTSHTTFFITSVLKVHTRRNMLAVDTY